MTRKLVILSWHDAHSPDATTSFNVDELDGVHLAMPMQTVGWLLRDDAYGVTVGCESCGGDTFRGLTIVPRAMVVSVTELATKRTRAPKVTP